jgi:Divergent InlB B-repeat domain
MANPSGPRVEATYARAMAAFQEGSFDVARRLIGEILIDDPGHAGARALRTRLEARMSSAAAGRSGHTPTPSTFRSAQGGRSNVPEATSVDPTVLIDRASSAFQPPEYIEPTVVIQREDVERYRGGALREPLPPPPPMPPSPPRSARSAPAPEPTVLIPAKSRTSSSGSQKSGGFFAPFWQRVTGAGGPPARRRSTASRQSADGLWTPTTRGIVMVIGGLVVASLFVVGVIGVVRAIWPGGHTLTFTKPTGGTVLGPGIQCGTRGSDCVTTPSTETVELQPIADSGYVFSGFKGDCAPSGRVAMTQPRNCGAAFDPVGSTLNTPAVTWQLTILKPTGGTIVGSGGLVCGVLGSTCAATLPDGEAVTLTVETATGFEFVQFTGDCNPKDGSTTMTAARTCSATFAQATNPRANVIPPVQSNPRSTVRAGGESTGPRTPPGATPATPPGPGPAGPTGPAGPGPGQGSGPGGGAPSPGSTPAVTPGVQGPTGSPAPSGPTGIATGPAGAGTEKPPVAAITPEDHAKREIEQLVKNYCAAMETLQPDQLKKLYPQVNVATHRELFRQYKSLKCTLAGPPEYDRLDASPAGGAQVKVGMKQQIEMKSGGAPKVLELIATIVVSRMSNQAPWLIDRLQVAPKPK